MKSLVWFRRDLRLQDNLALAQALKQSLEDGQPPEAVYLHEPQDDGHWVPGAASRWYLHHSLLSLQQDLAAIGVPLRCLTGAVVEALPAYVARLGASQVYWNRLVEPVQETRDEAVRTALEASGVTVKTFDDDCLLMPERLHKSDGSVCRVFTPFWRRATELLGTQALNHRLSGPPVKAAQPIGPHTDRVTDLDLLPSHPWHEKLHAHWQPGEAEALRLLADFLQSKVAEYTEQRDMPASSGTSRLSAALHFGEISVVRIHALCEQALVCEQNEQVRSGIHRFLTEIGWREFARHVLHAFPQTPDRSLNERFEREGAWAPDPDDRLLRAWQRGETGIALVDAGMRELWETGWMHNRVRMVVASFLTKNLGIHWSEGARWFWDTLVDADLASNTLGWQWVAGCGTDAAPYYRIFNPDTQAKKFDPEGAYISRWLGNREAGLAMVELKASRAQALERYQSAIRVNRSV